MHDTQWYKDININELAKASNDLLDKLTESLEVTPRTGTELINIAFTAAKADDAKTITNLVTAQYKRLRDETERSYKTQLFETLTTEQAMLQMEIDGLLNTKFNIGRRFGTDRMEDLRAELSKGFNAMESECHQRQREMDMMRWDLKRTIVGVDPTTLPADIKTRHTMLLSQIDRKSQEIHLK